jgi:hypothetical protein
MEPDDLLCSCNARPRKALVGHAQWETNLASPQMRRWKSGGLLMCAVGDRSRLPFEGKYEQAWTGYCSRSWSNVRK